MGLYGVWRVWLYMVHGVWRCMALYGCMAPGGRRDEACLLYGATYSAGGRVPHRIYDEYGSQKAFYLVFLALFQPQLACPQHTNTQS